jgi:deoxyribodipyrimidine photolyase
MIQDRLKALRSEMAKRGISLYVVPTADFHESEYVGEHFKARKYITGFTGSAGTAVINCRYALLANLKQLYSGILKLRSRLHKIPAVCP